MKVIAAPAQFFGMGLPEADTGKNALAIDEIRAVTRPGQRFRASSRHGADDAGPRRDFLEQGLQFRGRKTVAFNHHLDEMRNLRALGIGSGPEAVGRQAQREQRTDTGQKQRHEAGAGVVHPVWVRSQMRRF